MLESQLFTLSDDNPYILGRMEWVTQVPFNGIANFSAGIGGGKIHIFGGQFTGGGQQQTYARYDFTTRTWATSGNISVWAWSGGCYCNSSFWGITGNNGNYVSHVWKLNPSTGSSTNLNNLPDGARGQGRCITLDDKTIFCMGGYMGSTNKPTALNHQYDTTTNVWTRKADMPMALNGHYIGQFNGKIYVFGGWNDPAGTSRLVREYDPVTNTWRTVTEAPIASSWTGGTSWKQFLILCSVENGYIVFHIYDILKDRWYKQMTTVTKRYAFEMLTDDSGIYLVGGVNSSTIGSGDYYQAGRYRDIYRFF